MSIQLPRTPMAPITIPNIPIGPEWGYQIKWDGHRTLAQWGTNYQAGIFSKKVEPSNDRFPAIVELLNNLRINSTITDGEILHFDGVRPNFQRVLKGRRRINDDPGLIYVMFDLLVDNGEDIRSFPFKERFNRLKNKFPEKDSRVFVTDLHEDGEALWNWVAEREWEGIIAKRLDSPYIEGKSHRYWYKKRKELRIVAEAVGVKLKGGHVSRLVLQYDNRYIGHVAVTDLASIQILTQFLRAHPGSCPFSTLPKSLHGSNVEWISVPFPVRISALEFTDSGMLRQGKIIGYGKS